MYKEKQPARGGGKHTLVIALMTAFVLAVLPALTAAHVKAVDLKQTCSLKVEQGSAGETAGRPDLTVELYRVATAESVTDYDAYTLKPVKEYESLKEELEEAMHEESKDMAAEAYRSLAQKALGLALGIQGEPEKGEAVETAGKLQYAASIQLQNGDNIITGLTPGMYLMVVRGTALTAESDYVSVLENGEFATAAYEGGYLYLYSPELIALPQWESAENGGRENWNYSVTATLKSEQSTAYTSLKIRKEADLPEDGKRLTGTDHFVYKVEAAFGGKNVYSNVVMITLGETEKEAELVLPKIVPVGAKITVTEVYTGASHELAGEKEVLIGEAREDKSNDTPGNVAEFTNRYTGVGIGGGAVENRFQYEKEEGENGETEGNWNWSTNPENVKKP